MAESTLQERLRDHAKAFDGLLSLIPAKIYYGEGDTSDQWKKKKQTKDEKDAALRAKLDPDSAKSAKDIMDERARKRKLDEGADDFGVDGNDMELPKQGLKPIKKQKTSDTPNKAGDKPKGTGEEKVARLEAKKLKKQLQKDKIAKKAEAQKAKRKSKAAESVNLGEDDEEISIDVEGLEADDDDAPDASDKSEQQKRPQLETEAVVELLDFDDVADENDVQEQQNSPISSSPEQSPIFDQNTEPSASTSTSSTIPPATAPKHIKMPTDPELLKARLAARIEALRAARKADGPNGAPARNRQELMEARRKKEEERKAHKKELRRQQRQQEEAEREQALASARDSPASSLMSPALHTANENFSFGRVAFADGQQLADDLTRLQTAPKKRGPQDAKTALAAAEKAKARIAGLDADKRADIEEKEIWLQARKRAHGEKVRDDTSLLKKTLKRKEKQKKKSEKEWGERKEGVAKSQAIKQKKRTENLQKRKDESKKGKAKAKGGKVVKKGGSSKPKSRPGFEGSFGTKRK